MSFIATIRREITVYALFVQALRLCIQQFKHHQGVWVFLCGFKLAGVGWRTRGDKDPSRQSHNDHSPSALQHVRLIGNTRAVVIGRVTDDRLFHARAVQIRQLGMAEHIVCVAQMSTDDFFCFLDDACLGEINVLLVPVNGVFLYCGLISRFINTI